MVGAADREANGDEPAEAPRLRSENAEAQAATTILRVPAKCAKAKQQTRFGGIERKTIEAFAVRAFAGKMKKWERWLRSGSQKHWRP